MKTRELQALLNWTYEQGRFYERLAASHDQRERDAYNRGIQEERDRFTGLLEGKVIVDAPQGDSK